MESRNWIGGEWITPHGQEIVVMNPSNLMEEVGVIHLSDASHVYEAERAAKEAGKRWSAMTRVARGEILFQMAKTLEENLHELAVLASSEMGKPIGSAIAWGVKRGSFSNAAGFGSETFGPAAAEVSHPAKQGLVQSVSVYIDTLLVCSASGFKMSK